MHVNQDQAHLTYCSNIHPGKTWEEVFQNLRQYTTKVRDGLTKDAFGIGLRLSNQASIELLEGDNLSEFKNWLERENMYVFTVNGFPYGGFHQQVVKDNVHAPDWTTSKRLDYTIRLFDILAVLLPDGMTGGVSTSPLTYKFWHAKDQVEQVKETACAHLIVLLEHLQEIKLRTGKSLHLDMEPEPDGLIETSKEFISFFTFLLNRAVPKLSSTFQCDEQRSDAMVREHFQICYDVCHFAVGFEDSRQSLAAIAGAGIRVGRIQISAALSSGIVHSDVTKQRSIQELKQFDEPVYLHQAVIKEDSQRLIRFQDLSEALENWNDFPDSELRTHYHVPIFTESYGSLLSTQIDIREVLALWKLKPFTDHLEVETYTWDVLPNDMRTDIVRSVIRELQWVKDLTGP